MSVNVAANNQPNVAGMQYHAVRHFGAVTPAARMIYCLTGIDGALDTTFLNQQWLFLPH
ncbi:hypothetical protein IQ268_06430 [Oculatella sp. LEGE 06141]|uniref:hypothetical protein n=1 Tax=Oculatella sp. LEGE 06141 TaxID=1828648 RepID=UPI001882B345|nr:hypothetical protein [Oculatella sp. LEGE 06141]MBE9178221.1 hypothetical protein [Oculatella sp. LEGE 06141]